MIKNIFLLFLLIDFLFSKDIRVAVAANVSYAMPVIVQNFHKIYPNINVSIILGSSGKLYNQIKEGAPFDIFMSANMKYPQKLFDENIAKNRPKIYAMGLIALFSKKNIDFKKGLKVLEGKDIKSIAVANPKIAPYGKATIEALKNSNLYKEVKDKLIYAQSASQATAYAVVATDVGFVAKSSLYSKKMKKYKKDINWIEVDKKLYTPIKQGIVIINDCKEAKEFYNFIFSNSAKNIFRDYGYIL